MRKEGRRKRRRVRYVTDTEQPDLVKISLLKLISFTHQWSAATVVTVTRAKSAAVAEIIILDCLFVNFSRET